MHIFIKVGNETKNKMCLDENNVSVICYGSVKSIHSD